MPRSSARSKRSGGWRRSGRNDRPWTHRRRFVLGRFVVKLFVHAARVPVCSVTTRSWPSGTPQSRPHKSLSSNCLGAQHRVSSIERVGKFSGGRLRRVADGVGSGLLQEARAKLARRTVQSERPGHTAGAFAFCGVRTPFCDKGLRAPRSLGVGQRGGVAECLADRRGRARGVSLRASRDVSAVGCLWLTLAAGLCLRGHNRGFVKSFAQHGSPLQRPMSPESRVERWKRACHRKVRNFLAHRDGGMGDFSFLYVERDISRR
jgi:hypothetical protein